MKQDRNKGTDLQKDLILEEGQKVRKSVNRNTFWKRQDTWEEQFENINRQIKQINETTQIEPSQATPINVQEHEYVEIDDFRRALDDLEQKIRSKEFFLKHKS